jgi:hypothetical protein
MANEKETLPEVKLGEAVGGSGLFGLNGPKLFNSPPIPDKEKLPEVKLGEVVDESDLFGITGPKLIKSIIEKFNIHGNNCFTTSVLRGELIKADEFLLATLNNKPEIIAPSDKMIARQLYIHPGKKVKIIGTYKQTDLCFGVDASHVLNVPADSYAKAWINHTATLYGPGVHVIHDSMFKFNDELIKRNEVVINHEHIWIIHYDGFGTGEKSNKQSLFVGIAEKGYFPKPREKPYIFNTLGKRFVYAFFNPADEIFIRGAYKRLLVKPDMQAVTYDEGKQIIYNQQDHAIIIKSVDHIVGELEHRSKIGKFVTFEYNDKWHRKLNGILKARFDVIIALQYKIVSEYKKDIINHEVYRKIEEVLRKETSFEKLFKDSQLTEYGKKYTKRNGIFSQKIIEVLDEYGAELLKIESNFRNNL